MVSQHTDTVNSAEVNAAGSLTCIVDQHIQDVALALVVCHTVFYGLKRVQVKLQQVNFATARLGRACNLVDGSLTLFGVPDCQKQMCTCERRKDCRVR